MSRKSIFTNIEYVLRKLLTGTWDLYYVPTVTLYSTYHHHNPVTVPGPQCCDHLPGGGALYTLYSVQCVQCTVVSSLCRVTLDSCGADVRLFSHNTQCSVLAPPAQ